MIFDARKKGERKPLFRDSVRAALGALHTTTAVVLSIPGHITSALSLIEKGFYGTAKGFITLAETAGSAFLEEVQVLNEKTPSPEERHALAVIRHALQGVLSFPSQIKLASIYLERGEMDKATRELQAVRMALESFISTIHQLRGVECEIQQMTVHAIRAALEIDCSSRFRPMKIPVVDHSSGDESQRVRVETNPGLIQVVVSNLIQNAIQAQRKAGIKPEKADIHIHLEPQELLIQVANRGTRVPGEICEMLQGARAFPAERDKSGMGLPLILELSAKLHGRLRLVQVQDPIFELALPRR